MCAIGGSTPQLTGFVFGKSFNDQDRKRIRRQKKEPNSISDHLKRLVELLSRLEKKMRSECSRMQDNSSMVVYLDLDVTIRPDSLNWGLVPLLVSMHSRRASESGQHGST